MSVRFGRGDWYVPIERPWEDEPTERARDYFVQVVAKSLPNVITTFRDNVVPGLDRAWAGYRDDGAVFNSSSALLGLQERDFSHDALTSWAEQWNLSENGWLVWRFMSRAFSAWLVREGLSESGRGPNPDLAESLWQRWLPIGHWLPVSDWMPELHPEVQPLQLPGWDGTARTWGGYRNWIETEELPRALAEQKALAAQSPSLARTPTKYDTGHFIKLARWQLSGMSYADLGATGSDHHLRKAIPRTAALVGLTRRV